MDIEFDNDGNFYKFNSIKNKNQDILRDIHRILMKKLPFEGLHYKTIEDVVKKLNISLSDFLKLISS